MSIKSGNNGSFAKSQINGAWLSSTFGENYARKIFGSEIVDTLPRYQRGPRKGLLKGQITWRKIIKGGWISGYGGIAPRNLTYGHGLWLYPYGQEPPELVAGVDTYDRDAAKSTLVPEEPVKEENPDSGDDVDPNHPVYKYITSKGYNWLEVTQDPDLLCKLVLEMTQ